MRHIKPLLSGIAFALLIATGCRKDFDTESRAPGVLAEEKTAAKLSAKTKENMARLRAAFPQGVAGKLQKNTHLFPRLNTEYRQMALRALQTRALKVGALKAIEPTPCNGDTRLIQWLSSELTDWSAEDIQFAMDFGLLDIPSLYALIFENSSHCQYFGEEGQYTAILTKTFRNLRRFWRIESDDIVLVAMDGRTLLDQEKVSLTLQVAYGLTAADANQIAEVIVNAVATNPAYRKGDHPFFSFNAFAQPAFELDPVGTIPDKIVMGDGILEGFEEIGYGDVAPQAVLAHEFGHHVQFALGVYDDLELTPENSRYTELMADAMAAYYLSHDRGAAIQWNRCRSFLKIFFNLGDCAFTNPNHHGTPAQRMAAAEWGYDLANDAKKQEYILSPRKFITLFNANFNR
ncbi:MAG TPA: hypothetical protein VD794_02885, partial [Flavisolibacter sp.]|nr:hypothetical protein [Flavisolibacter sp.]